MSEFEYLKQSVSRVSRGIYKGLKQMAKVGLIFVHICEGLCYTRTKICRSLLHINRTYYHFFYCLETLDGLVLILRLLPGC